MRPRLSTRGWGIVDFDWSNAKKVWAAAKPMNCEEMLVEQVKQTTAASPGTTVWVYRNGIKALPWYTTVRLKVCRTTRRVYHGSPDDLVASQGDRPEVRTVSGAAPCPCGRVDVFPSSQSSCTGGS